MSIFSSRFGKIGQMVVHPKKSQVFFSSKSHREVFEVSILSSRFGKNLAQCLFIPKIPGKFFGQIPPTGFLRSQLCYADLAKSSLMTVNPKKSLEFFSSKSRRGVFEESIMLRRFGKIQPDDR